MIAGTDLLLGVLPGEVCSKQKEGLWAKRKKRGRCLVSLQLRQCRSVNETLTMNIKIGLLSQRGSENGAGRGRMISRLRCEIAAIQLWMTHFPFFCSDWFNALAAGLALAT